MPPSLRAKFNTLSLRLDRFRSVLAPLLVGFGAVLLVLAFALLASEVITGDTHGFDVQLLQAAQALRAAHPWVSEVMRDLSGLGSTAVLTLFTIGTAGYLALVSARTAALLVTVSILSATALVVLLKASFGRLRPDVAFAELVASGLSFPSGHASMSAVVFLTLGGLAASTRMRLAERSYILALAAVMTLLVGVSRVALGVHWATDVLAGWALGAAWAMGWLLLARRLARTDATDGGDARAATGQ